MSTLSLERSIAHRFEGVNATQHPLAESLFEVPFSTEAVESSLYEAFVKATEQPTADRMEEMVRDLGAPRQLDRLITEAVQDPVRRATIAAASEKHPLGFYKIPLAWSEPHYQLRLNIWPAVTGATMEPTEEDIHDHKFDFASKIVIGRLATRLYALAPQGPIKYPTIPLAEAAMAADPVEARRSWDWHARQLGRLLGGLPEEHEPKPVTVFRAVPKDSATHEAMTEEGNGFAQLVSGHMTLQAGSVYSLLHNTYHRAYQMDTHKPTATLFLRGKPIVELDTIARATVQQVDTNRPKVRLTEQEVVTALSGLVESIH